MVMKALTGGNLVDTILGPESHDLVDVPGPIRLDDLEGELAP